MPLFNADLRALMAALDRSRARIEFTPDGTIRTANTNFLDLMGYTLAEVEGRHHTVFVPPAERESDAYRAFWEALRRGEAQTREFQRITKSGQPVWIQATYNPVLDRAGRVTRVVKFASDITAHVLRNIDHDGQLDALHRSQAVIEFALDGTILTANANFLDAVGYRLDEIQGRHHSLFVDPLRRPAPTIAASGTASAGASSPPASSGASRRANGRSGSRRPTTRSATATACRRRW